VCELRKRVTFIVNTSLRIPSEALRKLIALTYSVKSKWRTLCDRVIDRAFIRNSRFVFTVHIYRNQVIYVKSERTNL